MADRANDVKAQIFDNEGNPVDNFGSLVKAAYDVVAVTYPTTVQEVYTHKSGGISGTTVGVVTVDYTDDTKVNLSLLTVT